MLQHSGTDGTGCLYGVVVNNDPRHRAPPDSIDAPLPFDPCFSEADPFKHACGFR